MDVGGCLGEAERFSECDVGDDVVGEVPNALILVRLSEVDIVIDVLGPWIKWQDLVLRGEISANFVDPRLDQRIDQRLQLLHVGQAVLYSSQLSAHDSVQWPF